MSLTHAQRFDLNHAAQTNLDYLTHVRILRATHGDTMPAVSDATGWKDYALDRRDEIPAGTYAALTAPWRAAVGPAHPDDDNTDDLYPEGWVYL